MINSALPLILRAVFGSRVSPAVVDFFGNLIPVVVDLVRQLGTVKTGGSGKLEAAVLVVSAWVDDELDDLAPAEWRNLPEDRRDRIIAGLVELILFVDQITASRRQNAGEGLFRRALQVIRRGQ